MIDEFDNHNGEGFVAPGGDSLLARVQANAEAQQIDVQAKPELEIPSGGLMERVQQVKERQETAERNPDARNIAIDAVASIESAVAKIDPRGVDPEVLKERILATIKGVGTNTINKYPAKPSPYESQFQ